MSYSIYDTLFYDLCFGGGILVVAGAEGIAWVDFFICLFLLNNDK